MTIPRSVATLLLSPLLSFAIPAAFAQQGRLLVTQKGDTSLAIVDPAAGKVIASVPEGGVTGHEVIASPDGRLAYVPIYGTVSYTHLFPSCACSAHWFHGRMQTACALPDEGNQTKPRVQTVLWVAGQLLAKHLLLVEQADDVERD